LRTTLTPKTRRKAVWLLNGNWTAGILIATITAVSFCFLVEEFRSAFFQL